MVDSVGNPTDVALSGALAAQTQLYASAVNIANATDGTPIQDSGIGSTNVAPLLTGSQPGSAAGQVFDALQATNTAQAGGGVASNLSNTGSSFVDLATQALDFSQASISYQANLATLSVTNKVNQTAINLVT
jgi:flagellar basal body rod protein FlgC